MFSFCYKVVLFGARRERISMESRVCEGIVSCRAMVGMNRVFSSLSNKDRVEHG